MPDLLDLTDHSWLGDDEGHNCETCVENEDVLHLCWPQAHLCCFCDTAPLVWPDIACEPCRAEVQGRSDIVADPIERLLSTHQRAAVSTIDYQVCACGATFRSGPGLHRRHVAELIYETLGVEGPVPWEFGPMSATPSYFDENGRVKPDA